MRCILLVLDGLGDKGLPELGGRTPLQAAKTPNLDRIARMGINGLYHSTLQGKAMPSEMAHFIMFGYDISLFPGRGIIEAVGEGIDVRNGDVAVLARTFSVKTEDGGFILKKEKLDSDEETLASLHDAIGHFSSNGVDIHFHPTKGISGISLLRGKGLSAAITDSNPIYEGRPIMKVLPRSDASDRKKAQFTADILNDYILWSHDILSFHPLNRNRVDEGMSPLNILGLQRPGQMTKLVPFEELWGLRSLCIASGTIYHGLCSMIGMDVLRATDTGDVEEDLEERLRTAWGAKNYDLIYVHSKAPDEAAHSRDPARKVRAIQDLDRALDFTLKNLLATDDVLFVVTSDHSTASDGKMIHSGETVPITMTGKFTRRDEVQDFDEISCSRGALGQLRGHELMYMILNLLDRGKLCGLMDSPVDQPYFPGKYTLLRRKS